MSAAGTNSVNGFTSYLQATNTLTTQWRRIQATGYVPTTDEDGVGLYMGNFASGVTYEIWGAQLEIGITPGPNVATGWEDATGYARIATFYVPSLPQGTTSFSAAYNRSADLDRSVEERAELNRRRAEAQSKAPSLQARLSLIGKEASEYTQQSLAPKGQVHDLGKAIEEKDKQIAESRELLDRDRDIRNPIGARNLYIAEIYDVDQSGDMQKPFGRVFYTKDKLPIFYGYDLDQQPGIKKAGVFQTWGGRGADRQRAVSLGLLYQTGTNQKRWVLKSNDAKSTSQIDAAFVTVEPEGGSAKPHGKPLLFTYLRLDPNHP